MRSRKVEERARVRFPGKNLFLAQKHQHYIGRARFLQGIGEAVPPGVAAVAQARCVEPTVLTQRFE